MQKWIKCAWVVASCVGLAFPACAVERFVWTNAPSSGYPFTSWNTAATTVQAAVTSSVDGDVVWVTNGTYILTNTITIVPTKAITLVSVNGRDYTTMQMDLTWGSNRCISLTTTGTIDGFTIANGCVTGADWSAGGGGIMMTAGTLQNCTVVSNRMTGTQWRYGGGIYCSGGRVINCLVTCNSAVGIGGGVYLGSATMRNCVISSNYAAQVNYGGGGVYMNTSSRITDCVVSNNASGGIGCGLAFGDSAGNYASNCIITDNLGPGSGLRIGGASTAEYCVVRNNILGNQVAACIVYSVLRNSLIHDNNKKNYNATACGLIVSAGGIVENCVISNNFGQNYGTGVRMRGGTLRNCLVIANTNQGAGIGVYSGGNCINMVENCTIALNPKGMSLNVPEGAATNVVINTIVYSNMTADITDTGGVNWFTNCNVGASVSGANNINTNPAWIDPANYNFRLRAGSPCINTGTNMSWMTGTFDLDGRTRIRYGTVDMGAYEFIRSGTIFGFH